MLKMKDSGYSERFRKEIVSSAQSAFKKILENHKNGTRPIHRSREQMLNDKGAKNSSGYAWWNKGHVEYNTVLYVPPTPNGVLLKMLKKREEQLNYNSKLRIKILEKGGTKFRNKVVKNNPFKPEKCQFKVCPLCKQTRFIDFNVKNVGKCKIANVGYRFICKVCDSTYEGETARLARSRTVEHVKDLENHRNSSPLVKHIQNHHKEEKNPQFKIQITGTFHDALSRQADEAVRINSASETDRQMNSRAEFNSAKISRIKLVKN